MTLFCMHLNTLIDIDLFFSYSDLLYSLITHHFPPHISIDMLLYAIKMLGKSYGTLISDLFTKGLLFRGIVPGLMRSSIANGCSMVAYKKIESLLQDMREEKHY